MATAEVNTKEFIDLFCYEGQFRLEKEGTDGIMAKRKNVWRFQ
jgi:hypothetical protein